MAGASSSASASAAAPSMLVPANHQHLFSPLASASLAASALTASGDLAAASDSRSHGLIGIAGSGSGAVAGIGSEVAAASGAGSLPSFAAAKQRKPAPANRNIPAFLNKLYSMVCDPSTDAHIRWNEDGSTFIVPNQDDFAKEVLPLFFKHNNFTSFIRQLNMYGFHKVPSVQHGSLRSSAQAEELEFSNENFRRDRPDLLCFVIRRKNLHSEELVKDGALDINTVLHELAAVKRHQLTISSDLQKIQRDNEVVWNESLQLRERYAKQQETIDKILRFLASVFSSRKKPTVQSSKRRRLEFAEAALSPAGSTSSNASSHSSHGSGNGSDGGHGDSSMPAFMGDVTAAATAANVVGADPVLQAALAVTATPALLPLIANTAVPQVAAPPVVPAMAAISPALPILGAVAGLPTSAAPVLPVPAANVAPPPSSSDAIIGPIDVLRALGNLGGYAPPVTAQQQQEQQQQQHQQQLLNQYQQMMNAGLPPTSTALPVPALPTSTAAPTASAVAQPAPHPPMLQHLANSTYKLNNTMQAAKAVEENIELLQDRLYDISNMVGLSSAETDSLDDWNVDDFIVNQDTVPPTTHGDDAALADLMSEQSRKPSVSAQSPIDGVSSSSSNVRSRSHKSPSMTAKPAVRRTGPEQDLEHLMDLSNSSEPILAKHEHVGAIHNMSEEIGPDEFEEFFNSA
ncbi:hypothetical protein BC831DRAFT_427596 [Entophlyctis helioformis]|nr:hypothetical protein BC831DRAFT_427596 [Entophlyctis helioformis]